LENRVHRDKIFTEGRGKADRQAKGRNIYESQEAGGIFPSWDGRGGGGGGYDFRSYLNMLHDKHQFILHFCVRVWDESREDAATQLLVMGSLGVLFNTLAIVGELNCARTIQHTYCTSVADPDQF
jgi:hypothetical protein